MAGNGPYVLDSFALLAYLEGEAAMPRVRSVLAGAARDCGGVVMTGDPEFKPLADAGLIAVEWLPRRRP